MQKRIITEGKVRVAEYVSDKISKELPVFYNPSMKLNRDISVLLLLALGKKKMRIADILAGSGVRSVRFAKELPASMIDSIFINDVDKDAAALAKKNVSLNKINARKIKVSDKDANIFLLESTGFDYIDIDPFGSPVPFLDAACRRLGREGILAVTATDTAPLSGTYPRTCMRRYWALPKKCGMMHELGIRILARRVQLIGAQYDKALVPVLSYSTAHYFRIFFVNEKGKNAVDMMMNQHGMLDGAGPVWLGQLWEKTLIEKMIKVAGKTHYDDALKLLTVIANEAAVPAAGFYDIHELCGKNKLAIPRKEALLGAIKKIGYAACGTHFKGEGIRSTIPKEKLLKVIGKFDKD